MKAIYIVCLIALLGAMMVTPAAATTWYAYDNATLKTAFENQQSGDTIFIYNGTYDIYAVGGYNINVPNLKVIGEGADIVTLDCVSGHNIRMPDSSGNATGSVLDGVRVVNSPGGLLLGTYGPAPDCIIRNCVFDGMTSSESCQLKADNVTFENNVILNPACDYCALCVLGDCCTIVNNTIEGNTGAGISLELDYPKNNIVTRNNLISNAYAGIELYDAGEGNKIYLNNFVDNGVTATTTGTTAPAVTYWNSTEPIEYTYGGSPYTNYLGNYWKPQYTGTDGDGNGIGDIPYTVPESLGYDYYPLVEPFENYPVSEPAPPDSLEFGDAPDPTHPSLLASNGARHAPTDTEFLGLQSTGDGKDFEPNANVPDADPFDDGLLTLALTTGDPAQTVDFEVTNNISDDQTLIVNILLDLNGDGDWNDPGEHVVRNQPIPLTGIAEGVFTSLPFSTVGATPGPTWMRITLTRHQINPGWDGTMASAGYAAEPFECGETEDWLVELQEIVPATRGNTLITDHYQRVFEVDGDGNLVWEITTIPNSDFDPWDAERLPNGNTLILNVHYLEKCLIEVDPAGNVIWRLNYTLFTTQSVEDVDMLPNGNLLCAAGSAGLYEVDIIGNVIWHVPSTVVGTCTWAQRLPDGNTVSIRRSTPTDTITEVNSTGDIVWQVSGLGGQIINFERLPDDNTVIAWVDYDAWTFTVSEIDYAGNVVWEVDSTTIPGLCDPSAIDRLPNGNTLIADYNVDYSEPRIIEVDPAGNIVWKINETTVHGTGPWGTWCWIGDVDRIQEPLPPLEFGDAPDPTYPSLLASNGARHIPTETECLGLALNGSDWKDFEPDANVPDLDLLDDGLLTTVLTAGNLTQTVSFEVTNMIAQNNLLVNILLDLNQNGIWDSGEHVVQNQPINLIGPADDTFTSTTFSTVGATGGPTWMRITLTRHTIIPGWDGTMASAGYAEAFECGETEDWLVELQELVPPTPFSISGEVDYDTGEPVPDPTVTVENTNTGEPFDVNISGNAYQVTTDSTHVSAGDLLHFNASNGNVTELDRTVESGDMDTGGLVQDITIIRPFVPLPDLIVESVSINPSCKHYYFANEPNVLEVTVKNIGTLAAGPSSASVSGASGTSVAAVGALDPGQSQTVTITDPVARPAGEVVTAIADCYGEVTEGDETNNASSIIDPDGNNYVINHGFKGKWLAEGYAGPDPGNMTTWKSYELHGDLNYSVGDSYYLSGYANWGTYNASWTASDLPISSGATVVEARLYVYYTWDKAYVMPDNVSTSFNGVNQDYDVHYTDRRGYGSMASYNLPYGALVYNVTDDFDTGGNYANVTKRIASSNQASMRGMMLVVVYEDPTEPLRQIFVTEEFDNLVGSASYCTTPEEATARALFTGPSIDMGTMVNANLITVVNGASPNEGDLIFNGQVWADVWNFAGSTELGIDERDVKDNLTETDNAVGFQSSGDWMEASNAFLVVEYEEDPDLIVSAIKPNCGYLFGNESNKICATIENSGGEDAGAFNVSFVVDGFSEEVQIGGLAAGASTEVCITDAALRSAGDAVTITVTADCNAEVDESDETNNASSITETVVNNGYKGKRYTGGEDITTLATYDLNGNLVYSVGDSYYLSSYSYPDWTTYNASWTASDLPVTGTVREARLYVTYTWAKDGVMPGDVSMSFNGVAQTQDAHYWDEKMFATSYPYGMLVYNVTDDFNTGGNYANLTNSHVGGDNVSMRGMLLVAIYENASEPRRLIYVNEEFDLLCGKSSQCTTPEEATAWAPITGSIDTGTVANATLITVAPGAGPTEGELIFNGQVWTDVWNFAGSSQIGIDERDVKDNLTETDNLVGFQSSGDYMEASNVFLVVELKIPAGVTFDKKKINLNSSGILKAFITLPEGYNVTDINVSTVTCEGAPAFEGSGGKHGKQAIEVKFKIPDLVDVPTGDAVPLTVTGELFDGTQFEGSNTLKVVVTTH
jgi:parallel beta-helix repeat protein